MLAVCGLWFNPPRVEAEYVRPIVHKLYDLINPSRVEAKYVQHIVHEEC